MFKSTIEVKYTYACTIWMKLKEIILFLGIIFIIPFVVKLNIFSIKCSVWSGHTI